jgi:hypothetical protein
MNMKTKLLFAVIFLIAISGCTKKTNSSNTENVKFLFLNASQLKPLGIELNEKGIFYKNVNPNWKQDHQKYACMAFLCTNNHYMSSTHFNETDTLKITSGVDSIIIQKALSKNDFYPLLIGNGNGKQSMEDKNLSADLKLLPIAICMAETKLETRKDTIVVWLKPTESLKKALPQNINMDDYLTTSRKMKL